MTYCLNFIIHYNIKEFHFSYKYRNDERQLINLGNIILQCDVVPGGCQWYFLLKGKVSEGIDFSDELCRAVFLIGVPFLPAHELKVIEKIKFIDSKCNSLKSNAWYMQQAIRRVNQALGRVIRHKNDYGAIFLCDSRFQTSKLSKWVQPSIQKIPQWNLNYSKEIHDFFQQKAAQYQQQDELEKKIKINEKQ